VSVSPDGRSTALSFTPSVAGGKHKRGFCAEERLRPRRN
jgi:hypothetical protein